MAASAIRIEWDKDANEGLPSFNSGPINLIASHLQQNVTDIRIAMIQGIEPDDFDLFATDSEAALPFELSSTGCRVYATLEVGAVYLLRLRPSSRQRIAAGKGYIPYRYLGADGHLSEHSISMLSTAFYSRVWRTNDPPTFRAAFAASAGTADAAAENQSRWLSAYFGCAGGRRSHSPRAEGDTLSLVRREAMLVGPLIPKHPDTIMSLHHALIWVSTMSAAIEEVVGGFSHVDGIERHDHFSNTAAVAHSLRLFMLHFLAFFNFNPEELMEIRRQTFPTSNHVSSKL